jgi:hypothetical protein
MRCGWLWFQTEAGGNSGRFGRKSLKIRYWFGGLPPQERPILRATKTENREEIIATRKRIRIEVGGRGRLERYRCARCGDAHL